MDPTQQESALPDAPGHPGIPPTWTSSAKDIVGCSLGPGRLWFTVGYGIINEIYYPRVDVPQTRDLGFLVGDGKGFWAEVKRVGSYTLRLLAPGVPAVEVIHEHPRYRLTLRIAPDPRRDVLAVETLLEGGEDLKLYALLAPHLGATGYNNQAEIRNYRGRTVLTAWQGPFAVALVAVDPRQHDAVLKASAGYVGTSDGWQDLAKHGVMTWEYPAAGPGNVALMAELPQRCTLGVGFGGSSEAAATVAISALLQPFNNVLRQQLSLWEAWHAVRSERTAIPLDVPDPLREQYLISSAVLRCHCDKTFPGAMVASLSVPWGDTSNQRGGYHLVWPRDLVECGTALLALGAEREARDTLRYLVATQHLDGHWYQNQWLGGHPYWRGIQLDEAAFPVLLAAKLEERDALGGIELADMTRRALAFVARTGPSSEQDRWEENAGINCFTVAVSIAALVSGSIFLDRTASDWALELADFWNANLERWCAVRGTELAREHGVAAYYIRTMPARVLQDHTAYGDAVTIRNLAADPNLAADRQISTDFLQIVRFGLRSPDDPVIVDTLKLVDALLKDDLPCGPQWRRYVGDGYGEHDDGRAFDGTGRGRAWPLLAGERGHYELAAGRDPLPYLAAMAAAASPGGMIPEQVWNASSIPARRLEPGRPSGSAMPLAWAHAEFTKLMVSRHLGHAVDRPRAVWERYRGRAPKAAMSFWWRHAPISAFCVGSKLVIALSAPAIVHWGTNGWQGIGETATVETGLGFHAATLDTAALPVEHVVDFTWRWSTDHQGAETWIGDDWHVTVATEEDLVLMPG